MRTEPMTMLQAARFVGWEGSDDAVRQRMTRYLKHRAAALGVDVATSFGIQYRVTESALRRHCPELFPVETDAEKIMRRHLMEERRERAEMTERIEELEANQARLIEMVGRLVRERPRA